jgi:hypothetical protein
VKLPVASHTFLNDWDNCPYKAYRKYIKKDLGKFVQTEAMKWGIAVHSAFEVRIRHDTPFPPGMEKFEALAAPFDALKPNVKAELALGITESGGRCRFFDNENVWCRGKLDICVTGNYKPGIGLQSAAIFDVKTGKRREDPKELKVHAVLLKAEWPSIQKITGHYVWLQDMAIGKAHDVSDTEKKLADIRSTMNTVKNCMEIEDFPKRRNPLCGWCDVLDCENNTKGR